MSFWRRIVLAVGACIFAATWLAATPSVAAASLDSQSPESDLGAFLLNSGDVPPGFELDPKQSGFHDEPLPGPSWLSPITQHATHIRNYQRFWINRSERRVLMAQVIEYPLDKLASTEVYSLEQDPQGKVENKFTIAAVPYARGLVVNYGGVDTVLGVFVRGSRVFLIEVVTPRAAKASEADIEFTRRLVMIQAAKAPPGPTKLRNLGAPWLAAGTALGTLGAAVAYIGGLSLLAWLRDPLRRRLTSASPQPIALPNITTVDIAARARRRRRRTAAGLVLELSGTGALVAGLVLLPSIWPLGLLLVALGVGMARIPRLVTAAARRATFESKLWTGRRRVRVNCYAAISTVCVLTGLLLMVLYGAGAVLTSPVYHYNIRFFFVCAVLLTVGALIRRHARRLAALDADEVLRRDSRPMVLYLRTFADDSLTIRTAPYARQSFADRLSPRRFERFEEVLVRNLTEAGPVVALNPPGTDLAPIGAARETLTADHWQSTITGWMTDAQLIVVGAAPEAISPGFGWELRAVDSHRLWFKTLLVLPPVPNSTMHARWERFTKVFADTAMARHPIPLDPASMLVLLGSIATGWSAVTADRRTEWTYAEALAVAITKMTSVGKDQAVSRPSDVGDQ